jgi:hypothetical protein
MSLWGLDLAGLCTYPRCFLKVCQRKGDAGASVRKCVKTNGMENEGFVVGAQKYGRAALARGSIERTCGIVYRMVI